MNIAEWIDAQQWNEAKTYKDKAPHEYLVKSTLSNSDKIIMMRFAKYIRENGYSEFYYNTEFKYYDVGDYKYWTMNEPLGKVQVMNRCKKENRYK